MSAQREQREILECAKNAVQEEGGSWIGHESTKSGHFKIMFNVGTAREQYIVGARASSHRMFKNIRADLRRKVREAKQRMGVQDV